MIKNEFYAGSPNTDRSSPISDYLYPFFDFVCRGGVRVRLEILSFRGEKMYFKADTRG